MMEFPNIDPIAIAIGPLAIRWYSLAYLGGVVLGWFLVKSLNNRQNPPAISKEGLDDIMVYAILGIVLGGRLGYVLFYKPAFYLSNPQEILMVWQGGMSFHGGLLGMLTAMYIFCRKFKLRWLGVMDLLAVAAPIGICLGRLANFINGELYGRPTDSPFGMVFPSDPESLPRYPSQLIEASLEGVVLFGLLLIAAYFTRTLNKTGRMGGLFLIGYSIARSVSEFFREPDSFIHFLPDWITMGQLLSTPMLLIGLYLVFRRDHRTTAA
jgi:phosphatidylglycerol:prolipoprotein diacylglycerol transferase